MKVVLNLRYPPPGTTSGRGLVLARVSLDADGDGDGVEDLLDNCEEDANPDQSDTDDDGIGDACNNFIDQDGDEFSDRLDNCPDVPNPDQNDTDGDGLGDFCNDAIDWDGDEYQDELDNCPDVPNDQRDLDGDGLGDTCDIFPMDVDHDAAARRELERARNELIMCLERPVFEDHDGDGKADSSDRCPETEPNVVTDSAGCSQPQFCENQRLRDCRHADWKNDEPSRVLPKDCRFNWRNGASCVPEIKSSRRFRGFFRW